MEFNLYKCSYLSSISNYEISKYVIAGIPMDSTVSFKPGSRFGPQKIREVSQSIEEYSIYQDKNLNSVNFTDIGDLEIPLGNTNECINYIYEFSYKLYNDKKVPIFLGGEHLVSFPLIKACSNFYSDLVVFHFDAHADMRDAYLNQKLSHATVMRRVGEIIGYNNIFQFGIRSGSEEEINFAKNNTNIFLNEVFRPLQLALKKIPKNKNIYLSIDIDVIDPAYAPATGTPEAGGISSLEMIKSILLLQDYNIVGVDVVELAPYYDIADSTALLAAKMIREILLLK